MAEDDGLTFSPVLVEDLGAVFGRDRWHGRTPFRVSVDPEFRGNLIEIPGSRQGAPRNDEVSSGE
jgi:hypothetical protein